MKKQKSKAQEDIIQSTPPHTITPTSGVVHALIRLYAWLYNFNSLSLNRIGDKSTSLSMMRLHASTYERIEVLPTFFQTRFFHHSGQVCLDLACGLNPFPSLDALAVGSPTLLVTWFLRLVNFLALTLNFAYNAKSSILDLPCIPPPRTAALLMKTLP